MKCKDLLDVSEDVLDAVALRQNATSGVRNGVFHDQRQFTDVSAFGFNQLGDKSLKTHVMVRNNVRSVSTINQSLLNEMN